MRLFSNLPPEGVGPTCPLLWHAQDFWFSKALLSIPPLDHLWLLPPWGLKNIQVKLLDMGKIFHKPLEILSPLVIKKDTESTCVLKGTACIFAETVANTLPWGKANFLVHSFQTLQFNRKTPFPRNLEQQLELLFCLNHADNRAGRESGQHETF